MFVAERINLLPGFVAARKRARRLVAVATLTAMGIAGGGALVMVQQGILSSQVTKSLRGQRALNATIAAEVARLANLEVLQQRVVAKTAALETLTADEVRWSVLLADLQAVTPRNTWLTGFSGTVTASATGDTWGKIEFQGATFSHPDVATWLERLESVPGFQNAYFNVSTKTKVGERTVVQFSSSVDLSPDALRRAQPGAERRP